MTAAVALAVAAGACAAAAIVELAGVPRGKPAARRVRLGGMAVALARISGRRSGLRPPAPGDLQARLDAAGAPLGLQPADVVALQRAAALAGLLLALAVGTGLPARFAVVLVLCASAGGYLAPQLVLARRARAREERVGEELADGLDLLRVAVEAGLPVGRALAEVGRRCPGLLASELGAAAMRMQLGATRAAALDALLRRCPSAGVGALCAAIARADRHGAPLAPALAALAADARATRDRRVRDDAARAAPKIQLVVALVLVPAVMLIFAAVLVRMLAPGG